MMAFRGMLVGAAEKAGMAVPPDEDDFDPMEFPHFHVFCNAQLGCAMNPGEHWENAVAITSIPMDKIKTVTVLDLIAAGYRSKGI